MNTKLIKYYLLNILYFTITTLSSQPVNIGKTSLILKDPERGNRKIKIEVYYPVDTPGRNAPFSRFVVGKLPFICFGHGFLMSGKAYGNIWGSLVPEGYIFVFLKKERGLMPSHLEMGKDLAFIVENFPKLSADSTSLFRNRIANSACLMGHSMGGGAAFLAASLTKSLKAVCAFAAYNTKPSAIETATRITAPALIVAGSNDCICPPKKHQIPMYNTLKSECKTFINIIGGSHCQMALKNIPCNFGEIACNSSPSITRKEQHHIINEFLIPWMDFTMKNNQEAGKSLNELLQIEKGIKFKSSTSLTGN
jgi:hypothetical protein